MLYEDNSHNTGTPSASPGLAFPWGADREGLRGQMLGRDKETQHINGRETMGNRRQRDNGKQNGNRGRGGIGREEGKDETSWSKEKVGRKERGLQQKPRPRKQEKREGKEWRGGREACI